MATKRRKTLQVRAKSSAEVLRARAIDLLADGWGVQEVADELGVSRGAIWAMRDDAFDAEVMAKAEQRSGAAERQRLGVMALEVLAELARNRKANPLVRRQAASDLADRAGLAAPKRIEAKVSKELAGLGDVELEDELLRVAEEIRERREAKG